MRKLLTASLLCFAWACSAIDADVVLNWNGARGVATLDTLNASVHGYQWGWEATYGAGLQRFSIVERTNLLEWPFSITVSNVAKTAAASTNWLQSNTGAGTGHQGFGLHVPGPYAGQYYTNMVVSGFFRLFASTGSDDTDFLLFTSDYGANGTAVFSSPDPLVVRAHGFTPSATYGDGINLVSGKDYYFVLARMTRSGYSRLAVFDPTNSFTLVSNSVAITSTNRPATGMLQFFSGYLAERPGALFYGPMFWIYEPSDEEIATLFAPESANLLSQTVVQATIDAADPGDIITLPAGYAVWTNVVINRKPLTLRGSAGTVIANAKPGNTGSGVDLSAPACLQINPTTNGVIRVEGIYFTNVTDNTPNYIYVGGGDKWGSAHIQNCTFYRGGHGSVNWDGLIAGLANGNVFLDCRTGVSSYALDQHLNTSWVDALTLGSTNTVCIESNYFSTTSQMTNYVTAVGMIMGGLGGRFTVRHNTWSNSAPVFSRWLDFHGNLQRVDVNIQPTISGTTNSHRGGRQCEAYNNVISMTSGSTLRLSDFRGGTILCASNSFYAVASESAFYTREEDAPYQNNFVSAYPGMDQHWLYIWGNTRNGSAVASLVHNNAQDADYLLTGTNVFFAAPADGPITSWTPLPYPHPLRGGVPIPPPPDEPSPGTNGVTIRGPVAIGNNVTIRGI